MKNLKRLFRFVKPHQQRMAGAAAAMGAVAAANFAILRMVEPIIDGTLVETANAEYVRKLAGVLVLLYLSMGSRATCRPISWAAWGLQLSVICACTCIVTCSSCRSGSTHPDRPAD